MNYLEVYLQIILTLAENSQDGEIADEELFSEIVKVPGFREYLEKNVGALGMDNLGKNL